MNLRIIIIAKRKYEQEYELLLIYERFIIKKNKAIIAIIITNINNITRMLT